MSVWEKEANLSLARKYLTGSPLYRLKVKVEEPLWGWSKQQICYKTNVNCKYVCFFTQTYCARFYLSEHWCTGTELSTSYQSPSTAFSNKQLNGESVTEWSLWEIWDREWKVPLRSHFRKQSIASIYSPRIKIHDTYHVYSYVFQSCGASNTPNSSKLVAF